MKTNLVVQNSTQPFYLASLKYHVARCRCHNMVFKVLSPEDCVAAADGALHCLLSALAEMKSNMASASEINNGNWTEWSAIWAEIIRVVSKSDECAAQVRFEITSMISDQNCTTRGLITTLLHPFWNRPKTRLGQFKYLTDAVLRRFLNKKWNRKRFYILFCLQNRNTDVMCQKLSQA